MKSISLKTFESLDLQPLNVKSSGGNIFYSDEKVYKLFKSNKTDVIINKRRKIKILSMMKDYACASLPVEKIVDGLFFKRILKGYAMDRDKRGLGLTLDQLNEDVNSREDFLFALKDASLNSKKTHERSEKIVLGDASFSNIMVYPNQNGRYIETSFVDFDSIQIGDLEADAVSKLLGYFFYYKEFKLDYGHFYYEMDKISHLLHFFYSIFGVDFFDITPYEFDQLSEQLNTLYRLRPTFYLLRNCTRVPEVPYLHEVIDLNDAPILSKIPRNQ